MLEQLAKHALIDLTIKAEGDLHIDAHHTVEDTGITLGQAIKQALGDKTGIRRYGHFDLVMDEARSTVALDLSNRPYLIWDVRFSLQRLGDMDTELFQEFSTPSPKAQESHSTAKTATGQTITTSSKACSRPLPAHCVWPWKRILATPTHSQAPRALCK